MPRRLPWSSRTSSLPRRHRGTDRPDHGAADRVSRSRRQSGARSGAAVGHGQAAGHRQEPRDGRRRHRARVRRSRTRVAGRHLRPAARPAAGHREPAALVSSDVERRNALAAATPSIWPAHGWLTSATGGRADPFTGEADFHPGLDISADRGTPVYATADGTVSQASYSGAYGNLVVVDHGSGSRRATAICPRFGPCAARRSSAAS